ncbi:MAG: ABC transporter ATP-binding protein/permease, partial [Chloroflexi bacterium]|nr:ABC transporter ATP-binding protein/permease [Chloroflexota bacterium]MCI0644767.1 ABC transporter ATP-binding protein/permease [Chloroflexota bacterium]MCI0728672.1 ABC transporter ATP-binding protein/permease [Chloroflexota bacterium]
MNLSEFAVAPPVSSDRRSPLRWILSHIFRHKLLIVTLFVGAFGNAALAAAVPVFIGRAFNAALARPPDVAMIGWMSLAIIVSQIVRAVLQLGRNFSSEVIGQRLERDTREELYLSLLGKSMTFHDLQPVGDTMARATNDVREVNRMFNPGMNLVVGSANFMLMPLLLSPAYDPALLVAPLFFVGTYILALVRYLGALSPVADRVRRGFGMMNSRLAEAIDGIETVKGTAQEEQEIDLFAGNAAEYRDAAVAQGRIEARFLPLLFLGITQAIGFTHALLLFRSGRVDVGDVVAYMGLLGLFGFPTFISLTAYSQVALGLAGARRILELMKTETKLDENAAGAQGVIRGHVRFENVTFGYVKGVDVLRDISFEVEPGQTVAIVGQTASGKSSVAKLINRTYDVQQGRILVDSVDVREWRLASLRQQISIIEQDIFLFSRTIAENIAFGCPDASQEMIEEAAKAAQAHDFIMAFKDGYQAVVGGRGVTLSGGQRQRIALARAFLTRPRVLILDDSTSAVDSATEDKIQQAIARAAANQTTILITHRLSQIRWADQVIVLRQGRLAAVGNHDSLMRESPAYRRIFEQY